MQPDHFVRFTIERHCEHCNGVLKAPQRLPQRDRINALIGRRDGIIHRAHEVSEAKLSEGMRDARSFIDRFAKLLLNLDLLQ